MKPRMKMFLIMAGCFCFVTIAYAHDWMAPKKDATIKNPVVRNEQSLLLGRTLYNEFCTHCHGISGKGLDSEEIGLKKRPTNLQKTLKTHSDGDIFWKIKTGREEMPSFKEDLEENETWSVIHYIRSF
jgi:mono/diheme cytochrome c family protein